MVLAQRAHWLISSSQYQIILNNSARAAQLIVVHSRIKNIRGRTKRDRMFLIRPPKCECMLKDCVQYTYVYVYIYICIYITMYIIKDTGECISIAKALFFV